jgi:hypothetical protein
VAKRLADERTRHEAVIGFKMPKFEPLMNPKETRQDFLKGNKEAVYYLKASDPNQTSYFRTFKGF